jgi:arginase family enzyme
LTKRAALSAESLSRIPPSCFGWFATIPQGRPPKRAKQVMFVFAGLRDVDPAEQQLLDRSGAIVVDELRDAVAALGDGPVFVHLDADVIDGFPSAFPPPAGGPTAEELRELLATVAARNEIVGLTIASIAGPPEVPLAVVEPLLAGPLRHGPDHDPSA